jgi:hypothetical protein
VKELKISVRAEEGHPFWSTHFQTIWQLSAAEEKSISAFKINILWDMAASIPYLVPTQFQELIFPLQTLQKTSAL